mgnify:CR=1 FL=1
MNEYPLIQIFCDGNTEIGFGHVRRSSALAAYLCDRNIPAVLTGLSKDSKDLLPNSNFSAGVKWIRGCNHFSRQPRLF